MKNRKRVLKKTNMENKNTDVKEKQKKKDSSVHNSLLKWKGIFWLANNGEDIDFTDLHVRQIPRSIRPRYRCIQVLKTRRIFLRSSNHRTIYLTINLMSRSINSSGVYLLLYIFFPWRGLRCLLLNFLFMISSRFLCCRETCLTKSSFVRVCTFFSFFSF